jgi:hypothetical protein
MMVRHPGMQILSCFMYDRNDRCSVSLGEPGVVVPWPVDFPTELVFAIFKYLSQAELANACLVSKYCMVLLVSSG